MADKRTKQHITNIINHTEKRLMETLGSMKIVVGILQGDNEYSADYGFSRLAAHIGYLRARLSTLTETLRILEAEEAEEGELT